MLESQDNPHVESAGIRIQHEPTRANTTSLTVVTPSMVMMKKPTPCTNFKAASGTVVPNAT